MNINPDTEGVASANLNLTMYEHYEKNKSCHYFKTTERVKQLLLLTDFNHNKIKLPFENIRIFIPYEDEYGYVYPHIYVENFSDGLNLYYSRFKKGDNVWEFAALELTHNLKSKQKRRVKSQLINTSKNNFHNLSDKERNKMYIQKCSEMGINDVELDKERDYSEDFVIKFAGNVINLINSQDVEFVTVESSEEHNFKRLKRGKLPIPSTTFIRLSGKLKIYLDKLNSADSLNFSHKFWVRGHYRVLRNKKKYKSKVGNIIWIMPYIKGAGNLINKEYVVDKIKN